MDRNEEFKERDLNDTKYASKIALTYLKPICADPNAVWATSGSFTGLLRHQWGLNSVINPIGHNLPQEPVPKDDSAAKNRNDHRHHAVDAVVIALTDRSMLQKLSTAFKQQEDAVEKGERVKLNVPPPWDNFRKEIEQKIKGITIHHRQDTSLGGQLHKDTNYGLVKNPQKSKLVTRKGIMDLKKGDISRIRDKKLREDLTAATEGYGEKEMKTAIQDYLDDYKMKRKDSTAIRHIRVFPHKEQGFVELDGEKYKDQLGIEHKRVFMPGDTWCVDIYKAGDEYSGEIINRLEANNYFAKHKKPMPPSPIEGKQFVVRIFKRNYIKMNDEIYCVRRINPSQNGLMLIPHNEGGNIDDRIKDKLDHLQKWTFLTFSHFGKKGAQKVHVDILGKIHLIGNAKEDH